MTTSNERIAEIANGLSAAQKQQILLCTSRAKNTTTGEPCFYRAYATREQTANVLVRLGLSTFERSGMGHRVVHLTSLGEFVRTHLERTK